MSNTESKSFKVLGVRPLKGCNKHVLKNLKEDTYYSFYENYTFQSGFVKKTHDSSVPDKFYGENISFHAIVGVNGSGKSTVIELMIRIINNLSYYVIRDKTNNIASADLIPVRNLKAELYYESNDKIFSVVIDKDNYGWKDDEEQSYGSRFEDLEFLFYSLVVNYSHYSYNCLDYKSEIIGRYKSKFWIESLFHKNDGYTTPVVLNPYRDKGIVDINSETDLSIQRLISIFTYFELHGEPFHDDYVLHSFELKVDSDNVLAKYNKIKENYWRQITKNKATQFGTIEKYIIHSWYELFIPDTNINSKIYELCQKYLVYKTISIIVKYKYINAAYQKFIKENKLNDNQREQFSYIVGVIKSDTSHVTLKLRQLINYMTLNSYEPKQYNLVEITTKFKGWFQGNYPLNQIMDLLPPPIFRNSFYLSYKDKKRGRAKISITDMSSGERQFLFSLSSVLYHLINLDSITEPERVIYKNIQIILEEIELYYHPEYQRKFIQTFIKHINLLRLNPEIQIDVLIATHSPFILSDIPKENILLLKNGIPEKLPNNRDTFCANFYDLLKYEFFLKDNAIGLFAQTEIEKVIKFIENKDEEITTDQSYIKKTIDLIGDTFLKGYLIERIGRRKDNV